MPGIATHFEVLKITLENEKSGPPGLRSIRSPR